jgi:hypothetical protein
VLKKKRRSKHGRTDLEDCLSTVPDPLDVGGTRLELQIAPYRATPYMLLYCDWDWQIIELVHSL